MRKFLVFFFKENSAIMEYLFLIARLEDRETIGSGDCTTEGIVSVWEEFNDSQLTHQWRLQCVKKGENKSNIKVATCWTKLWLLLRKTLKPVQCKGKRSLCSPRQQPKNLWGQPPVQIYFQGYKAKQHLLHSLNSKEW